MKFHLGSWLVVFDVALHLTRVNLTSHANVAILHSMLMWHPVMLEGNHFSNGMLITICTSNSKWVITFTKRIKIMYMIPIKKSYIWHERHRHLATLGASCFWIQKPPFSTPKLYFKLFMLEIAMQEL
jgi:hypothetical protein